MPMFDLNERGKIKGFVCELEKTLRRQLHTQSECVQSRRIEGQLTRKTVMMPFNNVQINVLRVCYNDFQENILRFVNFVGEFQILIRASYISWFNSTDYVERSVRELKLMAFSRIEKFEYKLCENLDIAKFILQQEVKMIIYS